MSAPTPASTTSAPPRRSRRIWPLLLALPLLIVGAAAALLWWSVRSEPGSAWLVAQLPGLRVTGAKGTLLGDFSAQRIEIALPREGAVLLDDVSWQGLRIEWIRGQRPRIVIERLAANRVEIRLGTPAPAAPPEPPPQSLALPVELVVDSLEVQTLQSTAIGATPLRKLRAQVHLGAEGGGQHRVDGLSLAFGQLRAQGAATLGSAAPLPLQARVQLTQEGALANAQWSANATLAGPLATPQLQATLRAQPMPGPKGQAGTAQSLDLSAQLRPFERWPLGALDARASGLDLSALHPDAPITSLSGRALAQTTALDQPAVVSLQLQNATPGLWNEGRLPLQRVTLELRARPDDPSRLELQALDAELGTAKEPAGRIQGGGRWSREGWNLDATLAALQPSRLDARAPKMQLAGPVKLQGSAPEAAAQTLELRAELNGQLADRGPARSVHLKLDAGARRADGADRIELREALATAGGARASLAGSAARASADGDWSLKAHALLAEFDPAPWWPGREDSPWRRGPHKLNATGELDLTLPHAAAAPGAGKAPPPTTLQQVATLRGQATLKLNDSLLAGVPLRGEASLRSSVAGTVEATLQAESDANKLRGEGRIASRGDGAADSWNLTLDAPALAKLAPVWRLASSAGDASTLAGALNLSAKMNGRWPQLTTSGQLQASGVRVDSAGVQRGSGRWQAGTALDAPVDAQIELAGVALGPATFETVQLQLQGNGRAHRLELRAASKTRPPAWTDTLQGETVVTKADAAPPLSTVLLQAQGGLVDNASSGALSGWRGSVQTIELGSAAGKAPWVRSKDIGIELLGLDAAPLRATLQPGRAEVLGAALRWSKAAWQAAQPGAPAQIDAQAELEPLAIAPLLARLQPDFGWGGDLLVTGKLEVHSAPSFAADIVLERSRGDLTVTDEVGTQALGLTDLRLGLNAADGTWSFTQGLAGSTLGVAAGAFVARTTPQATWPAADAPVSGVLQLEVANLGTWGTWVPPGWRLGGALKVSAGIGGRFGAPEYTGSMEGHALSVRNFLQGVNVSDGEVAIALQGASARIERFTARAGTGTVTLAGNATLGSAPQALLKLTAQKFQLLGRVDRRIVASGEAQLQLERDKLALDGRFRVDEGLIDFTRSDAPSLADDVAVVRSAHGEAQHRAADEAAGNTPALALPKAALDLQVDLGEQLRLRGRGLDSGLRGELRITSPGGRLAVNGTVRAVDGTYAAYGQKLEIDRGDLTFNGPAENPRLDIEATRPNLDVRVGVAVTGTAVSPRVRLFSEPDLSDLDKLSWLVLGRASDGLGRTDTALLQRAALALLAGDGEGPTDQITRAIGLDEVSLRQTEGDVRETVISLGKQLSRRWYVGYERSLNATTGSWQLIYRIAQRFTLRAQSGEDSSLDLIWTWRWH